MWRLTRKPSNPSPLTRAGSKAGVGGVVCLKFGPLLGLVLLLALLAGCKTTPQAVLIEPPEKIVDSFVFAVHNQALQAIPGARIRVNVETGQALEPGPFRTDQKGRAVVKIKARRMNLVRNQESQDRLYRYRSVINYLITAPGWLPVWGRSELNDSLQSFKRLAFSQSMNTRPKDKDRLLAHTLIKVEEVFEAGALQGPKSDPLARTVAAGLADLWRIWSVSGRLAKIRPLPGSWNIRRRAGKIYLALGLEIADGLKNKHDTGLHQAFADQVIPLLDDLAVFYGPFVDGWELNLNLGYQPPSDPHAMPESVKLRMVFSESVRTDLLTRPGGLNWLILKSESLTLDGQQWRPVEKLAQADQRLELVWSQLGPLLAPGPGEVPNPDEATESDDKSKSGRTNRTTAKPASD